VSGTAWNRRGCFTEAQQDAGYHCDGEYHTRPCDDADGCEPGCNRVDERCNRHRYLSTGCLHEEHAYCQGTQGAVGAKRPAECKFCSAPCVCTCHEGQS